MAGENRPLVLSYADYLKLPPESPGEVIDGALVVEPTPTFRHQTLVLRLVHAIQSFLDARPGIGCLGLAPLDVVLVEERPAVVLQPDVLFIAEHRRGIIRDVVHAAPDLVIEVVSPTSARWDAMRKRELYARHGVREYWLVWPEEASIDVMRLEGPGVFGAAQGYEAGQAIATRLLPGFELDVGGLFQP